MSSIKGQGGRGDVKGIGIPFRIKGPWSNPSYEPDLSGVLPDILDSITNGDNPIDNITGGSGLDGILGKKPPQQEGADDKKTDKKKKPKGENPLNPLKDLLGGGQ